MPNRLLITALFIFLASPSFAGLLIEPYVGYASLKGSGTATLVSGGEGDLEESTSDGLTYGGRLGYGVGPIGAGIEVLNASGDDVDMSNLGAFVTAGAVSFRAWATYLFSAKYDVTGGQYKGTEFEGSGMKVGVGYRFLPFLSLNAEYLMLNYDEVTGESFSAIDYEQKGFLISLSFPFVL
jgi:hypothetical protein